MSQQTNVTLPDPKKMAKRRYMRQWKAAERGSKRSYKTEVEDLCVLLALARGDLSQGQAARLLNMQHIDVRAKTNEAVDWALAWWDAYREAHPPKAVPSKPVT